MIDCTNVYGITGKVRAVVNYFEIEIEIVFSGLVKDTIQYLNCY